MVNSFITYNINAEAQQASTLIVILQDAGCVSCALINKNKYSFTIVVPHIIIMTDNNQHTTLPHVSQTAAAPVTSTGTTTSVVIVTSTQVHPTNGQTPASKIITTGQGRDAGCELCFHA